MLGLADLDGIISKIMGLGAKNKSVALVTTGKGNLAADEHG
jgi:hypothetical protein